MPFFFTEKKLNRIWSKYIPYHISLTIHSLGNKTWIGFFLDPWRKYFALQFPHFTLDFTPWDLGRIIKKFHHQPCRHHIHKENNFLENKFCENNENSISFVEMRRMTGGGSFRYTVWDPFMIVSQMSTLQCLYYVSLGIWIFVFDVLSGTPRSLDHIFQYQVCVFFQNIILTNLQSFVWFQTLLSSQIHGKLLIAALLFNALTWWVIGFKY